MRLPKLSAPTSVPPPKPCKRGHCIHFTGIQNEICELGISYADYRREGVSFLKTLPCFGGETRGRCARFLEPTEQQLKAYEDACNRDAEVVVAISVEVAEGKTEGEAVCACGGRIRWKYGSRVLRAKCDRCDWSALS